MEKELLSITAENTILITAAFHKHGQRNKAGEVKNEVYEIDLIVRNDITFNQLLEAIEAGIRQKLKYTYGCDVYAECDSIKLNYKDIRHPESETPDTDEKGGKKRGNLFSFWRKENKSEVKAAEESLNAVESNDGNNDSNEQNTILENENDKNVYLVCWKVFAECYKKYLYPSENNTPRRPVIGISCIDYNSLPKEILSEDAPGDSSSPSTSSDKTFLSKSDRNQITVNLTNGWGKEQLKNIGFITTTRVIFDPFGVHHSATLYDMSIVTEAFRSQTPLYNISERPLIKLDEEPVHVIPPTDPPQKSKQNLVTTLLTPLLMTAAMIGARLLSGMGASTSSLIIMSGCMGVVTVIVGIINLYFQEKEYTANLKEWREHYQEYITRLINDIVSKQSKDISILKELFPPARSVTGDIDLIGKSQQITGDIFSRDQDHPDFMKARIGLSTDESHLVPSVFKINGEKKETIFASATYHNIKHVPGYEFGIFLKHEKSKKADGTKGYLVDLPSDISKQYAFLPGAPVLLPLRECGTLGVVFDNPYQFQPFLSNLLLDLCFYQSPDNLQCVMFCEETKDWIERQNIMKRYKYLPHFRELLGNLSPFAFDKADAYKIFNKLLEIISARKNGEAGTKYPHILVIVLEEHDLKKHAISEYLPSFTDDEETKKLGISFIFCKRYPEELPKYCGQVIRRVVADPDKKDAETDEPISNWYLLPHLQMVSREDDTSKLDTLPRYEFCPDSPPPFFPDLGNKDDNDQYIRAYKSLSALYYERIAQGSNVPTSLELLDILGNSDSEDPEVLAKDIQLFIKNSWGYSSENDDSTNLHDITKSLAVPVGKKSDEKESDPVYLDLHEKGDGPHMLVAGTTGSGKTETILTYLVGLCATFSPEQVNLLLMDMKGAGFVQRIGDAKTGNCLPHVVGTVTDISGDESGTGMLYMLKRFLQSMDAEVKRRKLLLNQMGVDSVDNYTKAQKDLKKHLVTHPKLKMEDIRKLPPLPHLFLVIDEFTELMKISGDSNDVDFKKAITSLARIGRSLGFHIILISQNIENAITPDIRVNSRARLCLKVATREASKEMIGTDLAASPLMPGNGRAYLLVGTGSRFEYFQSGYSGADITRNLEQPIIITQAETSGEYTLFFDSENYVKSTLFSKSQDCSDNPDSNINSCVDEKRKDVPNHIVDEKKIEGKSISSADDDMVGSEMNNLIECKKSEIVSIESPQEENPEISEEIDDVTEETDKVSDSGDEQAEINEDISSDENKETSKDEPIPVLRERTGITQVKFFVDQISKCFENSGMKQPHCVFQQPLPNACYFEYDWSARNGSGTYEELKEKQ